MTMGNLLNVHLLRILKRGRVKKGNILTLRIKGRILMKVLTLIKLNKPAPNSQVQRTNRELLKSTPIFFILLSIPLQQFVVYVIIELVLR